MTPEQLAQLAMKTGLKVATCEDLLRQGWTYVEEKDQAPAWVHPMSKLQDRVFHS